MTAAVCCLAALFPPTPYELAAADLFAHAPAAAPVPTPPRLRRAAEHYARTRGLFDGDPWYGWDEWPDGCWWAIATAVEQLESCPPLSDAGRFPDPAWCDAAGAFNAALAQTYRDRIPWEPDRADRLDAAARQADAYAAFWREAAWVNWRADDHARRRRLALRNVRDALGAEAYAAGDLPDPAPHWLFVPR